MKLRFALPLAALFAAACQDAFTPLEPDNASEGQEPQARVLVGAPDLSELAGSIQGFGGMFIAEDGVPTVLLIEPSAASDAAQRATDFLSLRGIEAPSIRMQRAEFTLLQLDDWFQATSPKALGLRGTVFVDLDEKANRVTIGVVDQATAAEVRQLATRLGVPESAVQVVLSEPIQPLTELTEKVQTIDGGIQIGFSRYTCTLGFNARDTDFDGFVTASHCTETQGGEEDTRYYQPLPPVGPQGHGPFPGVEDDFIGTEDLDPLYVRGDGTADANGNICPRGKKCRYSDAARASYAIVAAYNPAKLFKTTDAEGSTTISGEYTITADGDPIVGTDVRKIGATTGRTTGEVTATNVDAQVVGGYLLFKQFFVAADSDAGDSGAPVFSGFDDDNVVLHGMLWGGTVVQTQETYVASPMSGIREDLGTLTTY